jgi:hypothetical protein
MHSRNPYKEEFARLRLSKMMAATSARDQVARDVSAAARQRDAAHAERDRHVIRAMVALIDHAYVVGSALASIGLFPVEPTYKQAKRLVDMALAAADAPSMRGKPNGRTGLPRQGSAALNRMTGGGGVAMAVMDSTVTAVKNGMQYAGSPMVQEAARLLRKAPDAFGAGVPALDYIHKGVLMRTPIGMAAAISEKMLAAAMDVANWLNTHAAFINTVAVVSPLLTSAGALASTVAVNDRIGAMESLAQRYGTHCRCGAAAQRISHDWMAGLGGVAIGVMPIVGAVHVAADIGIKVAHRLHKTLDHDVHRPPFYTARDLWGAGQPVQDGGQHACGGQGKLQVFPVRTGGRCPMALLVLATLFGGGDPAKGMRKAAAAVIAGEDSAVGKIKKLVGADSGSAFETAMHALDA